MFFHAVIHSESTSNEFQYQLEHHTIQEIVNIWVWCVKSGIKRRKKKENNLRDKQLLIFYTRIISTSPHPSVLVF